MSKTSDSTVSQNLSDNNINKNNNSNNHDDVERYSGSVDINVDNDELNENLQDYLSRHESHVSIQEMQRTLHIRQMSFKQLITTPEAKKYCKTLFIIGFIFFVLCTCLTTYIYGCFYKSTNRIHHMKVLAVDLDGGVIGKSLVAAYNEAKGDSFLTFVFKNSTEFSTPRSIEHEVFKGKYWAAIYSTSGASDRLLNALQNDTLAKSYDPSTALYYVWNQVHYTSVSNSLIQGTLQKMGEFTRKAFYALYAKQYFAQYMTDQNVTANILNVFLDPIDIGDINLQPTPQLESFGYNTIGMVIVCLIMFFFMLGTHIVSLEFQVYNRFPRMYSYLLRHAAAVFFGLLYGLMIAGCVWWFREGWHVNANQFVLTWLVYFLLMHVNFVFFDCFACFVPISAFPIIVIIWIVTSVMACILPLPLTPNFYHWAICLPSFNAYNLLTSIWSRGASPVIHRALPVLFAWEVLLFAINIPGHAYRCKKAAGPPVPEEHMKKVVDEI